MAAIDPRQKKAALAQRFLSWYCGEVPPVEEPSEYTEPLEEPLIPADAMAQSPPYHNKTIAERTREWAQRSGEKSFSYLYNAAAVVCCILLVSVLLTTVAFLPPFGHPDNPANNEVPQKYIEEGVQDTGAVNIVAGIILDYRAFDTFGESNVLFIAACAVLILMAGNKADAFDNLLHEMEEPRHDIILKKIAVLISPMIMIFGFYVVMGGHLGPGGGFSGGAIIGASLILYASAHGTRAAHRFFTLRTYRHIVTGSLLFYGLAKGYSFFTGANHIASAIPLGEPGNLLSAGLILPLNIAVGLVVASTMYIFFILFSKGGDVLHDL